MSEGDGSKGLSLFLSSCISGDVIRRENSSSSSRFPSGTEIPSLDSVEKEEKDDGEGEKRTMFEGKESTFQLSLDLARAEGGRIIDN